MGGTRGSCIVPNADDVQGMSIVRGTKRVGGACKMCMCLTRVVVEEMMRVSG